MHYCAESSFRLIKTIFLLLLLRVLMGSSPVQAQVCLNNYALVGTATQQNGSYQLTQNGSLYGIGAMWSANTINLNYDFDFTFLINQCGAADGVLFVLHHDGTTASSGAAGGSLGYYQGINNDFAQSLAIELDTYDNGPSPYYDADNSHLVLVTNRNPLPVQGPFVISPALGSCRDRELHITWDHQARLLTAALDGQILISHSLDLVNRLFGGNPRVTFGFIGSTGGQSSTQTITPGLLTAGGPSPTVVADGPTTFCGPGAVTLRVLAQPAGTTYAWSPAVGLNDSTAATVVASPTTTTVYSVAVTTPDGCTSQGTTTVTVYPPLRALASGAQTICAGGAAVLRATSTGGGPPPSYQWSPTAGLNTALGDSVVATPAVTTRYTVTAITRDGCIARDTVQVSVRPPTSVAAGPDQRIRPGRTATLRVPVPTPGTTYLWSPAAGLNTVFGPSVRATPVVSTRYTVTATDSVGCTAQDSVLVEVSSTLQVAVAPVAEICPDGRVTLFATSEDSLSRFEWSPAFGLSATTGASVTAAPGVTTTYTVIATDTAGYTGQTTVQVRVAATPAVVPQVNLVQLAERQVRFELSPVPPTVTASRWAFGDGSAEETGFALTHTYPQPGTYQARLTATYGPLCTTTVDVPVVIPAVVVPNIITPNHDGLNDTFQPIVSTEALTLRVYNRWGRLVFEQADYQGDWAAADQAAGTYYYLLTAASGASWKGWLEVVR